MGEVDQRCKAKAWGEDNGTMTPDAWQAQVTREAAKAMGQWLEGRGRLHQPIAVLTLADLEAMAVNAITCFITMTAQRIRDQPEDADALTQLLHNQAYAPSAPARPAASATSINSGTTSTPITASAHCAARTWAAGSPKGTTA